MKKVFMSLFLLLSLALPIYSCGQSFVIKKVSHILDNILRRIEKDSLDFTEQEVRNTIDLFHNEYRLACSQCRYQAEMRYFHIVHILSIHLKNFKRI